MNQELQYLRDELNQRLSVQHEHSSKTINMVLLIWSGVLIFFGRDGIKFTHLSLENVPSYFIVATIFFISNLILYYTARRYYSNTDSIFKLGTYIAVFYEKRPSVRAKVGENFSWELSTFEILARNILACDTDKKNEKEKHIFKRNVEYIALTAVSTVLIFILFAVLLLNITTESGVERTACFIVSLICVVYLLISIRWLCKIPKYTSSKDDCGMRIRYLSEYVKYALDTGHFTKEELKDRLGDIWNYVKPVATAV